MKRAEYQELFQQYPDVVTIPELCTMLGGIAENTARKLLRGGQIKYYYIRTTYFIPKENVIDYLLSPHYRSCRMKLKHTIQNPKHLSNKGN